MKMVAGVGSMNSGDFSKSGEITSGINKAKVRYLEEEKEWEREMLYEKDAKIHGIESWRRRV